MNPLIITGPLYKKKAWARANPERVAASKNRHAAAHPNAARDASKRWRKRNPNYRRNHHLKTRYGITLEERDALFALQGNACAVCGVAEPPDGRGWVVDHSHETGKVRGVICNPCNLALGYIEAHPPRLEALARYLAAHAA